MVYVVTAKNLMVNLDLFFKPCWRRSVVTPGGYFAERSDMAACYDYLDTH
jgi:hypothetical protein